MGECLANEAPFGVVRALEQGIEDIGCTADIVSVTKEYPDGRMDLVAQGRKRFSILHLNEERSFLRAEVLLVPDEPGSAAEEERSRAIQLHQEILSLAGAVQDLSGSDQVQLSFQLAASLPLELDFQQQLLTIRSERERLRVLSQYLERILPKLHGVIRTRQQAGGNGHPH